MSAASVADMLAFQALPDETRALVCRMVGGDPTEGTTAATDLERAYRAGWEACGDDIMAPGYSSCEFKRWQESRKPA